MSQDERDVPPLSRLERLRLDRFRWSHRLAERRDVELGPREIEYEKVETRNADRLGSRRAIRRDRDAMASATKQTEKLIASRRVVVEE